MILLLKQVLRQTLWGIIINTSNSNLKDINNNHNLINKIHTNNKTNNHTNRMLISNSIPNHKINTNSNNQEDIWEMLQLGNKKVKLKKM